MLIYLSQNPNLEVFLKANYTIPKKFVNSQFELSLLKGLAHAGLPG